jgi:gliding motility-associated-like protein
VNLCDTTYVIIKVNSNVLFFPEFISPNGDNSNEFWDLGDLASYPDNELTIMNRWGDALYHAQPYNNEWNGQSNMGIPSITEGVTDGTYFFVFIPYPGDEPIKGFIEIRK